MNRPPPALIGDLGEANRAGGAELKKFAGKQVPTSKKHLELARSAGQRLGSARAR